MKKKVVVHEIWEKKHKNSFFFFFQNFEKKKKKPIFWKKMVELLPARFQGPPKMDVTFFWAVFLLFSVSSASSKRVLKKNLFL